MLSFCCGLLYGALPGTGLKTHTTLLSKQLRQGFEQDQQQHTAVVQALSSSSFRQALWATLAGVCGELDSLCKGTSPACMACQVPADHLALHTGSCPLPDQGARAQSIKNLAVCLLSNHLHKPMQHLSQELQSFLAKGKYGAPDSAAAANTSCSSSHCNLGTSRSTTGKRTEQSTSSSTRASSSSRRSTSDDTAVAKDANTSKPSTHSLQGDNGKHVQHRSSSNNKKKGKKTSAKQAQSSRLHGAEEPQVETCGLYRAFFGEGRAPGSLQGLKFPDGRAYQLLLSVPTASYAAEAAVLQALDCEMPVTLEQLQLVLELLLLIWQPEVDEGRQRLDQQGQHCSGGSRTPPKCDLAFSVGASQRDWLMLLLVLLRQAPIKAKQQLLQQRGILFLQLLYAMLQKEGVPGHGCGTGTAWQAAWITRANHGPAFMMSTRGQLQPVLAES